MFVSFFGPGRKTGNLLFIEFCFKKFYVCACVHYGCCSG